MSEEASPSGVPMGNREQTPDPHGRNGVTARSRRGAFSFLIAESSDPISPIPIAAHTFVPVAGEASESGEAPASTGACPDVPGGWGSASGILPIPIAFNGQFGQDSDEPIDKEHEINSMEEDFEYANKGVSLSRELPSLMDADHPAQGEKWPPDGSDEDTSDLVPQADKAEIDHQYQAKHDRGTTGRTPAPQLKRQRNEDYD
eukprot:5718676-Pyramimonas_sp.AAC.1